MTVPKIVDLLSVEFEHGINEHGKAFVVVRAILTDGVGYGQVPPAAAREISTNAANIAARAEYEQDAWVGLRAMGMADEAIGLVLHAVRDGEQRRMSGGTG